MRPVTGTQAARLRPFSAFNMVYSVRLGLPSGVTQRPMMLSMLISPFVAVIVGIGSTIGFVITGLPMPVVARAATHIAVGYIGAKIIIKNRSYVQAVLITGPIHGLLEMIVVIPFIGLTVNWALVVTLVGSIMHHMVDGVIAYVIVKAVAKSRNKDIYDAFGEFTVQQAYQ